MYTQAGKNTINLNRRGMGVVVIGFIVVLVLIILALASVYTVPAGYVGVITRFNAVIGVANPGLGCKIPFVDQIVDMSVQTKKMKWTLRPCRKICRSSLPKLPSIITWMGQKQLLSIRILGQIMRM